MLRHCVYHIRLTHDRAPCYRAQVHFTGCSDHFKWQRRGLDWRFRRARLLILRTDLWLFSGGKTNTANLDLGPT